MQLEPRSPRNPPSPIEPTGFFTGLQVRPIIVGVVVDYIATYAAMYAYIFFYLSNRLSEKGEVSGEAISEYLASPEGLLVGFIIGALCTVMGGFVAGRKAGRLEVKHGAFVGVGSLIVSAVEQSISGEIVLTPEWFRVLSYIAIIPAGALGGYIAGRFRELMVSSPTAYRPR